MPVIRHPFLNSFTMKKFTDSLLCFTAAMLVAASCTNNSAIPESVPQKSAEEVYTKGTALVHVSEELASVIEKGGSLNSGLEITSLERLFPDAGEFEARTRAEGLHLWYKIEYDTAVPFTKASGDLSAIDGIDIVEPDRIVKATSFNDPMWSQLWGLKSNKGGGSGINVEPVWENYTTGSDQVIVAVIDGGVQVDHEDLSVIPGGIDGSKNFVDGGFNITSDMHGTHVAGTIGAISNNAKGVSGIAGGNAAAGIGGVRILSCQFLSDDAKGRSGDTASAIKWAADHGATVCNNSWVYTFDYNDDGNLTGDELRDALNATIGYSDKAAVDYFIKYAGYDSAGKQVGPMAGGVVIFAAGNENIANGAPANYAPIIAVGATTQNFKKANFSNYGDWVDICAPGTNILSTVPTNKYGPLQGTSMACPHVTGVAALLISYYGGKGFTNSQLIEKLLGGANHDLVPAASRIGPFLDAMGAFTCESLEAPDAITGAVSSASGNRIDISFAVPGDSVGNAAYKFLVAASHTKEDIEGLDPYSSIPDGVIFQEVLNKGAKIGESYTASIDELEFESNYYVVILAANYHGKYSTPSEVMQQDTYANNSPVIEFIEQGPYEIKASEVRKIPIKVYDPDSHSVTISLTAGTEGVNYDYNADEGILTVEIRGRKLSEGTYAVNFTVTDKYDASAKASFDYTILHNEAPVALKNFEDLLIYGNKEPLAFDLAGYFQDPEQEEIEYKVRGYNIGLVKVSVDGSKIILSPQAFGLSSLTVVAEDAGGKECSQPLNILIKDPDNVAESFPNPVIDKLTIRTEKDAPTDIRITNSVGSVVYNKTLTVSGFNPAVIDMRECAPGKYRLDIAYEGKKFSRIIVKK